MYVCVCRGITDRAIRGAAENGARSVKELQPTLGVASDCCRCARCAHDLLKSCRSCPRKSG